MKNELTKLDITLLSKELDTNSNLPVKCPRFALTKKKEESPEIGRRSILGSILSIIGSFAAPMLIPAIPGLGFIGTLAAKETLLGGLVRAGLGLAGSFIGGAIGNLISPAETASFGNLASPFRDQPFSNSPTFSLRGIQNNRFPGAPVPVIYGKRRIGGTLISQRLETIGDDTYFWGLFSLCEGEVESVCLAGLSDLLVNGQPGSNFQSVELWTRVGTKNQTTIPGFEELIVSYVQSAKLTPTPSIYTTVTSAMVGFAIRIEAPGGIYSIDNQGNVAGNSAKYRVEYKSTSSGLWIDLGVTTISDSKIGVVRHTFEKRGITADRYDIKITRTSPEQTGSRNRSDIFWVGIEEITGDEFIYPQTALAGIKIKATNQLSGNIPTFTFLVEGLKVKDVTDINAPKRYSRNPADGYYDLLTNKRYGLGRFVSQTDVNLSKLALEATHFNGTVTDGDGGTETRALMDIVIDTHADAQQTLVQLMSSFRASPLWSEGLTSLVTDRARTAVHIFNMGNIIKDSYSSSFPDIKNSPNKIIIQFPNADKDYKMDTISVVDEDAIARGKPIRTEQMLAAPITRKSEAYRLGNYRLNVGKFITRAVEFEVPPEAVDLQAGDVFLLQHDIPQWGWGGRIENVTGTTIVIDQEFDVIAGKSYVFQARLPDGTIEERDITNSAGATKVLTIDSGFSTPPSIYSPYFVGETDNKKLFACVAIAMSKDQNRKIVGVEYNGSIYGETVLLPDDNASALPTPEGIPPDVENLTLLEDQATPGSIIVSFNLPSPPGSWNHSVVELSSDGGTTYFPYVAVENSVDVHINSLNMGQTYFVKMPSFSRNKIMSANPPTANITITGDSFVPPTVKGLEIVGQGNVTEFTGRDVSFQWKKNNPVFGVGIDGAGSSDLGAGDGADVPTFQDYRVTIYVGGSIVRVTFTKDNAFRYTEQMNIEDNAASVRAFQIRVAERNSFNASGGEAILDVNNPAPSMITFTPTLVNHFEGVQIDLGGFTPVDADFQKYLIYMDTGDPPTTLVATLDANTKQIIVPGLSTGTKYYAQAVPYDVFGAGVASLVADITTSPAVLRDRKFAMDSIEMSANSPVANTLYWTAGNMSYVDNNGDDQIVAISSGDQLWTTGTMFLYWVLGASTFSTSTDRNVVFNGENVIIATYKGGSDMTVVIGRVIIDGSDILAGTVTASQLTVATAIITVAAQIANLLVTNAHIANATIEGAKIANATITNGKIANATIEGAKIANATITDAQIDSLNADKITAGTVTGRTIRTAASGSRVQMDTTELVMYKGSDKRFEYNISSGDLIVGDYANANGFMWDESTGVFKIRGFLKRTNIDAPVILPFRIDGDPLGKYRNSTNTDPTNRIDYVFGFPFFLPEATTTLRCICSFFAPSVSYTYTARFEIDALSSSEFSSSSADPAIFSEDIIISSLNAGMHFLMLRVRSSAGGATSGKCLQSMSLFDPDNLEDTGQTYPFYKYNMRAEFDSTSYVKVHEEQVIVPSGAGTVKVHIGFSNNYNSYNSSNKSPSMYVKVGSATSGTITDTTEFGGLAADTEKRIKWNSTTIALSGSGSQLLEVYAKLDSTVGSLSYYIGGYIVSD